MDVRSSALIVTVYTGAAAVVLSIIAISLGVYNYTASEDSLLDPSLIAAQSGAGGRSRTDSPQPARRPVLIQNRGQIQELERRLAEKTEQLAETSTMLHRTTGAYRELRADLEQYLALADELLPENAANDGGFTDAEIQQLSGMDRSTLLRDLSNLREELAQGALVESAMELELSRTREALEAANESNSQLQQQMAEDIAAVLEAERDLRTTIADGFADLGADAVPTLVKLLEDSRAPVRKWAAEMLAAIGTEARDAIPALVEALVDDDEGVRAGARQALTAIGE